MASAGDVMESLVALPSGDALTSEEANQTTRSSVTRVIVPVGPVDVGKTTLLSEIYEKFLEGPFAEHQFVWSRTLLGSSSARMIPGSLLVERPLRRRGHQLETPRNSCTFGSPPATGYCPHAMS